METNLRAPFAAVAAFRQAAARRRARQHHQHHRPAGAEADAAISVLQPVSKAGLYWLTTTLAQAHGPAHPRQCGGAGPHHAQCPPVGSRFRPPARRHHPETWRRARRCLRGGALSAGRRRRHRPDAGGGWRPASDLADPRCAGERNEQSRTPAFASATAASAMSSSAIWNCRPISASIARKKAAPSRCASMSIWRSTTSPMPRTCWTRWWIIDVIEKRIRAIIAEGHVRLAETLAERIASGLFRGCPGAHRPGAGGKAACPAGAESVGVEIERTR